MHYRFSIFFRGSLGTRALDSIPRTIQLLELTSHTPTVFHLFIFKPNDDFRFFTVHRWLGLVGIYRSSRIILRFASPVIFLWRSRSSYSKSLYRLDITIVGFRYGTAFWCRTLHLTYFSCTRSRAQSIRFTMVLAALGRSISWPYYSIWHLCSSICLASNCIKFTWQLSIWGSHPGICRCIHWR